MGLLEDAIREHLDLKRKHGAQEDELERQEVEALGPVRREASAEQLVEDETPLAEPAEDGGPLDETPLAEADSDPEVLLPPDPPLEPDPAADHELPPDPGPDFEAEPGKPEASERFSVDQPTELFDVVDVDDQDDDADLLEDTPDFLQDAPEHDRLWFEQKPPRDFDFD